MPEHRQPGKLAVILHADIAGSTLLVQQDEHLAHQRIQETFGRFSDFITRYHGNVRELRGDALLAEFERASDAVSATLAFQADQAEYTTQLDDNILPRVRVGIAMGEVVIADNTVTGEGVVLAQRVEQLAEPGRLCITGAINEALPTRLPFTQRGLGEKQVKGFDEPVRVYSVALKPGEQIPPPEDSHKPKAINTLGISAAIAGIILVIAGGLALWLKPWQPQEEPASVERMAFPIPEKPSIAVLPFNNLSGNPDQEFLADGLSEEIITVLSKVPNLFVIARNSTFTYKGKAVSVKQVAEEQGVRYVLEGSIQRSGDRIRINAQLIDALEGHHLWAERYDREFKDIFALQDDITQNIMVALQVKLTEGEEMRYLQKRSGSPKGFEYFQKSRVHFQRFNKEDNAISRQLMTKALELSPENPTMLAWLAWNDFADARFGWSTDREASIAKAKELGDKAYALDPLDVKANAILGSVEMLKGRHEEAIAYQRKAVELAPSDAIEIATLAWILCYSGSPEQAIPLLEQAMRLSPYYPAWFTATLGLAYFMMEDYDEAIAVHEHLIERKSMLQFAYSRLAAINAILGNEAKSREYAAELLKVRPEFTIESWSKALLYRNPERLEWELNALRAAGLPEKPPLPLPDKPSIAVLPFTNMSGDPEQEYFADGITEDIITELSRFKNLFVISRTSSFAYKDKNIKVQDIGRELGVRYLLEGSVRRSGKDLRITAQLIEAQTGRHLWAEKYDRQVDDVFSIQDEINGAIVTTLGETLWQAAAQEVARKPTLSFEAYDYHLRGLDALHQLKKDDNLVARKLFEKARGLDPGFGGPYRGLAWTYLLDFITQWVTAGEEALDRALDYTNTANALEPDSAGGHRLLGRISQARGNYDEALARFERALELNPNDGDILASYGSALIYSGRSEEGIKWAKEAIRRNPHHPDWYTTIIALGHYFNGRYDDTLLQLNRIERPRMWDHRLLAAAYAQLGNLAKAKEHVAAILAVNPETTISTVKPAAAFKKPADVDRYLEGLRKAGLPE